MKKALITGINGFVGQYLQRALQQQGYQVAGTYLPGKVQSTSLQYYPMDLLQPEQIETVVQHWQPDEVYHLAGQSSVALSWQQPAKTMEINVNGTLHLLDAIKKYKPNCKILVVGSSDEYGPIKQENGVVKETDPLQPVSPYGISKMTQEKFAQLYARTYQMNIIMVRPFNHIGPGQHIGFVVADFASRIAAIEQGKVKPILKVGNLHSWRDFTDVEDVVAAYVLLMQHGSAGEVYNVGSGQAIEIQQILNQLLELSRIDIIIETDPARYRPVDVPLIVCDNSKLVACTGWKPQKELKQTLLETLNYWRKKENLSYRDRYGEKR